MSDDTPSAVAPDAPRSAPGGAEAAPSLCSPALSEKSWAGGVRGSVLDALRELAHGDDHVLVNLKRLAAYTGISYGSVRNAMSRLTRSGDIRTRQIRVADGHGVRVEFLTPPGAEGTAPAALSGAQYAEGGASLHGSPLHGSPQTAGGRGRAGGQSVAAGRGVAGMSSAGRADTGLPGAYMTTGQGGTALGLAGVDRAYGQDRIYGQGGTDVGMAGQHGGQPMDGLNLASGPPMGVSPHMAGGQSMHGAAAPAGRFEAAPAPALPTFWDTAEDIFALAWPHAAAAGLGMARLRRLMPVFAVQGFDAALLPRSLRYVDWQMEHSPHEAPQLAEAFVQTLQRRGFWPKPAEYDSEEA